LNNSGLGLGKGSIELKARAAGKSTESGISLSSTSMDFGEVDLGTNSINTLKISNIGGNNLRVFNVTWDSKSGGENLAQFEFVDNTHKNIPILAPGESHDLKIKFEPQSDKDYAARFILTTNDPINEGLVEVPVAGKGKDISSVREGIASIEGLTVKINPNPVVSYATISYTLEMPGNISIDVIDASGRKIEHITNGFLTNGEFNRDFNTDNIANGMYFISVDFNGQKLQIPFIVTK
jgi:hypothetical protein